MKIATRVGLMVALWVALSAAIVATVVVQSRAAAQALQQSLGAQRFARDAADLSALAGEYIGFGGARLEQQWASQMSRLMSPGDAVAPGYDLRPHARSLRNIDSAFQEMRALRHQRADTDAAPNTDDSLRIDLGELEQAAFIRAESRRMYTSASADAESALARAAKLQRDEAIMVLAIMVAAFLALSMAGLGLSRRVARGVPPLLEGLQRFARGDLSHGLAVDPRDEIGDIAASANAMASQLELVRRAEREGLAQIRRQQLQQQADAARLSDSERRYRLLFVGNPLPMWIYDLQSLRILEANAATVAKYGYSADELLTMTILDLRPDEDRQALLAAADRLRQHDSDAPSHSGPWRHRLRDGSVIEVEVMTCQIDHEGRRARLVMANDITERRRSLQALQLSERRLSEAQRLARLGHWELTLPARTLWWSEQVREIFRLPAQHVGDGYRALLDRVHPDDRPQLEAAQEAAQRGLAELDLEHRIVWPDGAVRHVHDRGSLHTDPLDGSQRLLGTIMDITERKLAAIALEQLNASFEEQQRVLEAILESTQDAIVACDQAGRLTFFNRAARQLHGLEASPVSSADWPQAYALFRADGVTPMVEQDVPLYRALHGLLVQNEQMVVARHNGDMRILLASGSRVIDKDGVEHGAVVSMHDITERKAAERALVQAHANLERQVSERTAELAAANRHLQELDRLKSMFVASMSHELRTPLNSIIGFTGMMLQEIPGSINPKQRDYLGRVLKSGQHLLALISDVIDIAKVEAGKMPANVESFDLGTLIGECLNQVRGDAEKKGLALTLDLPADVTMTSDRRRLAQCLLNYLSNALKYTTEGMVSVHAARSAGSDLVEISVRDTGIGIAPIDHGRLFQQFCRIDSAITRRTLGTGLGLYITRKLTTDVLHGRVSMDSLPGQGSIFRLHLPTEIPQ